MGALRRAGREAAVLAAFLLLTGAMTWPWVAHLRDTSFDPGDSYLVSYVLAWDFHQTFRDPLHLFDASIFYPYKDTLALSESQWGTALLFFPALAAGLRPLTVHGLAMLFSFAFSGYGAFRLARTLTGSALAGWVAGVAFAFVPYRFHHLPHLPYVAAGWLALTAEGAILFARRRTWGAAAWLGAAWLMSGLTSIHWFVLGALPVALAALLLPRPRPTLREWGRAIAALAAASLLLLPFYVPYLRASRTYGTLRTYDEVAWYSARLVDWITPDWNLKLWSGSGLGANPPRGEFCLFPGALLLVLAAAGIVLAWKRRDAALRTGLVFAALGFVGSFGMNAPLHPLLYRLVPPFRAIRVPARWAMVADLGLAILAALAVVALADRVGRGSPRRRAAVVLATCALLLFEDRVAPLYLYRGDPDPDALTRKLAATPMKGGLWQLPDDFGETNARYVLRAADHWKPLVNGYSGFNTPIVEELHALLLANRPADLLTALEKVPVSYVTIRRSALAVQRASAQALVADGLASGRLRFIRRFPPGDDLFAVVKTEPGAVSLEAFRAWRESGSETAFDAGPEDAGLVGNVDAPAQDETVKGALVVSGWARVPGEDLDVQVFLDGEERGGPVERRPRPDVQAVIPSLGNCSRAGWRVAVPMGPEDAGDHQIVAVFRARDGRVRHFPPRRFTVAP